MRYLAAKFYTMSKSRVKPHRNLKIPKSVKVFARVLQFVSPALAMRFAARLFTTPVRHQTPRRELAMERESIQEKFTVRALNLEINVYRYGSGPAVLLVHGWSGRGTQLVKFADALKKQGFSTLSFDGPAHGKSSGKTAIMPQFIASVLELEKKYGPFEAAVGHSLGGMTLLNAARLGLKIKSLVVIGSGDVVRDIIDEFVQLIGLRPKIGELMQREFEKTSPETMEAYSAHKAAAATNIPVLVIHDLEDREVHVNCARNIASHMPNGELMLTKGLGHRKILGSPDVIERSVQHIIKNL